MYFPENVPGNGLGRTLWSGYGSMVLNDVILPYKTCRKVPDVEYMSKWVSVTCNFVSIVF